MPPISEPEYLKEFPIDEDYIYLNHAAVGPWPLTTAEAVKKFADENSLYGASHYPRWIETETSLRKLLQQFINAESDEDIALLKNTSEALSVVAYGIQWNKGDEILITDQEFPSNRIVWESLAEQGVIVRYANLTDAEAPGKAIIQAITPATRLISVSSVQFASGLRLELQQIGDICQQNNILFCVDAIQSLGAFEFDAQKIHADFVMADAHKWLMAPEGIALFYTSPGIRQKLKLHQYGWHMVEALGDYDSQEWQPAKSARRFECGSPNMLGIHALHASLKLLLGIEIKNIERRILQNTRLMIDFIQNSKNLSKVYDYPGQYNSGIVTFRHQHSDNLSLFNFLTEQKVICAQRGGGIRFSPHFYSPKEKILQALQLADNYSAT
jgi:selenocysteine lyase/cysteine desulfurase